MSGRKESWSVPNTNTNNKTGASSYQNGLRFLIFQGDLIQDVDINCDTRRGMSWLRNYDLSSYYHISVHNLKLLRTQTSLGNFIIMETGALFLPKCHLKKKTKMFISSTRHQSEPLWKQKSRCSWRKRTVGK